MKYFSRLKLYKAPNLTFNPETIEGRSYHWYLITRKIGKTVLLNGYNYSNTTVRHIYKIRSLLNELNIDFITIEAPRGLQDLTSAENYYLTQLTNNREHFNKPRTRQTTKENLNRIYNDLRHKLDLVRKLKEKENSHARQ